MAKHEPLFEGTPLLGTEHHSNQQNDESNIEHGNGDMDHLEIGRQESSFHNKNGPSHKATIGILGSISIAVNYLTGPAMLELPATYQRSGFLPTTLTIIFVCILSILCCQNMANVVSKIKGNSNFQKEIEYSEAFKIFWGHNWFVFTQIAFFCYITCQNIASIVDTAQVVDEFLAYTRWGAFAMCIMPFPFRIINWTVTSCPVDSGCDPFDLDDDGVREVRFFITGGYVISMICFLPLGLMDLKENASWQIFGFILLLVISVIFILGFIMDGLQIDNMSLWGSSWSELFGIILFNFAFTTAVPAWLYEKSPDVNVPTIINASSVLSSALYIFVGSLGALAIPNVSENMLSSMIMGSFGRTTQISASIFAFFIIGLGIPLFSVLTRLNLTGSGLVSHQMGNFLAVYLPWGISWTLYKGSSIAKLLSWGGVLFTSIVAFLAPLLLALHAVWIEKERIVGSVPTWGIRTRRQEIVILSFLLVLAVFSVLCSIAGQFVTWRG